MQGCSRWSTEAEQWEPMNLSKTFPQRAVDDCE